MKSLLTIITLLTLSSVAMAHGNQAKKPGKKRMGKVVIKAEKAKTLFEALDAEIVTKDKKQFTADIKKVATLRCVKLTKKEDTSVVKFKCIMGGKIAKKKPGQRRGRNGQGRGRGPRRGGNSGHNS